MSRPIRVILLLGAVWSAHTGAQLIVIHDSGDTRPLAPLLEHFSEPDRRQMQATGGSAIPAAPGSASQRSAPALNSPQSPDAELPDPLQSNALPSDALPSDAVQSNLLGAADPAALLPIQTPELSPGRLRSRPLRLPEGITLPRPFFLIGSDPQSRAWLEMHRDYLQAIGAVGMLVAADTVRELEHVAQLAQGLPILPASASDIAQSLGLRHIPVLISAQGIEQ